MKCISIPQPSALAAVHGVSEVINVAKGTRYRGPLLVHDRKAQEIIGVVVLADVSDPTVCQLRHAEGPRCWIIRQPLVFKPPLPMQIYGKAGELVDVEDDQALLDAISAAMTPSAWQREWDLERMKTAHIDRPRRADGFTGD